MPKQAALLSRQNSVGVNLDPEIAAALGPGSISSYTFCFCCPRLSLPNSLTKRPGNFFFEEEASPGRSVLNQGR
jgi:hypothetical protein